MTKFLFNLVYKNYTSYCSNSAFIPDCNAKAAAGQCGVVLATGYTVGYYCALSCNLCGGLIGPSCTFLSGVCGTFGTCSATTYFGVSTLQCTCSNGYTGAACNIGMKNSLNKRTYFL